MGVGRVLAVCAATALVLSSCSFLFRDDPACRPVDVGGECFAPSNAAFVAHALTSATAWPQLLGASLTPGDVIEGFDEVAAQPTWVVALRADGRVVAASRFLPVGDRVRLAEVALYEPPRLDFPTPGDGQQLVLILAGVCGDPMPEECLFTNYGWRFDPAP